MCPNKFSDEIKYLQDENNTKNCIVYTLLEKQKIFRIRLIRDELKSTNPFFLPKKSSSNIKPPSSNLITTSNSFDLFSENSPDANNVNATSIEDNNTESNSNKSNKPNTSISTEKKVNFRRTERNKSAKKTRSLQLYNSMTKDIWMRII